MPSVNFNQKYLSNSRNYEDFPSKIPVTLYKDFLFSKYSFENFLILLGKIFEDLIIEAFRKVTNIKKF